MADLAATGFAISPLSETVRAVQLLADRETPAVNAPWVRWARNELGWRPLRLPRLWPLIVNGLPTHPEFQAPAPEVRMPELGVELARLCATPAAAVRASLHRVWEGHPWPESARELAARPRESLAEIAAEIGECYDRLIAPHWERIRPVLEADIAYRAGLLADGGARSLFSDLHPDLHWSGGTLTLTTPTRASSSSHARSQRGGAHAEHFQLAAGIAEPGDEHPDHHAVPGARGGHGMGRAAPWPAGGRRPPRPCSARRGSGC